MTQLPTVHGQSTDEIVKEITKSVRPISFTVTIQSRHPESGRQNEQDHLHHTTALLVKEQLLLMSAGELKGPFRSAIPQWEQQGYEISTSTENFKVEFDGNEIDAHLLARDSPRDLAAIKLEEAPETAVPVEFSDTEAEPKLGDRMTLVSRFGEELNHQPRIYFASVSGKIEQPRMMFSLMGMQEIHTGFIGSPAIDRSGNLVGMVLLRPRGSQPGNMSSIAHGTQAQVSSMMPFVVPGSEIEPVLNRMTELENENDS